MNSFPMIKAKWSNEHIMAAVFVVLVLYNLPRWGSDTREIFNFILLVCVGLLIECVASILRYKRLWCCVSGAVTAGIVSLLTYGVPIWGRILGVAAALIIGKHIWGGTGKNLLNPAMIGLLAVMVFYQIPYPSFEPSMWLLPAVIISFAFLFIRPFAGAAFILGMTLALIFTRDLSFENVMSYGVFFWGCMIMTDPVTITPHPVAGSAVGFLAGFTALYYFPMPVAVIAGVLTVNLFSDIIDSILGKDKQAKAKVRIKKVFPNSRINHKIIDLTGEEDFKADSNSSIQLQKDVILERIRVNAVFGMGGAAFPAYRKIITVMEAEVSDKHLIINGAECDPGLLHDEWIVKNHMDEVALGVKLLSTCIPFQSIHLTVKHIDGLNPVEPIKLKQLPDLYPIGAEKILINKILNKNIGYNEIPASEGVLVLNVQTVYSICQAVINNKPIETRYLTVADLRKKTVRIVKARLDMKLSEIMKAVYPDSVNIYAGGGIMQSHLAEEDETVGPKTNFICTGPFPSYKESPQCSKCGMCSRNCPSNLKVNVIADLVDKNKLDETKKYRALECISCGSCSYSCLAGRNLAVKVKRAKDSC